MSASLMPSWAAIQSWTIWHTLAAPACASARSSEKELHVGLRPAALGQIACRGVIVAPWRLGIDARGGASVGDRLEHGGQLRLQVGDVRGALQKGDHCRARFVVRKEFKAHVVALLLQLDGVLKEGRGDGLEPGKTGGFRECRTG
jgi:hypothetical protein